MKSSSLREIVIRIEMEAKRNDNSYFSKMSVDFPKVVIAISEWDPLLDLAQLPALIPSLICSIHSF